MRARPSGGAHTRTPPVALAHAACAVAGISVPSGLFVPCILVGSGYGRLIGELIKTHYSYIDPGVYALVGATSMLGGVTRMTISLAVILVETTGNLRFLLPIMLVRLHWTACGRARPHLNAHSRLPQALMVSKWVGDLFNISLYDMHVEIKARGPARRVFLSPRPPSPDPPCPAGAAQCVPFVEPNPPQNLRALFARDVMNTPVVTFREKERVGHVLEVLRSWCGRSTAAPRPAGPQSPTRSHTHTHTYPFPHPARTMDSPW